MRTEVRAQQNEGLVDADHARTTDAAALAVQWLAGRRRIDRLPVPRRVAAAWRRAYFNADTVLGALCDAVP